MDESSNSAAIAFYREQVAAHEKAIKDIDAQVFPLAGMEWTGKKLAELRDHHVRSRAILKEILHSL